MSDKPVKVIKLNVINEPKDSYTGGKSSLCPGCGHDQVSSVIVNAAWENGLEPHRIAKMSGIGCSSKTPAYYLGQSHGFNTVHGRMPSVTAGAKVVNKDLTYLGVSGDGDSASAESDSFPGICGSFADSVDLSSASSSDKIGIPVCKRDSLIILLLSRSAFVIGELSSFFPT